MLVESVHFSKRKVGPIFNRRDLPTHKEKGVQLKEI